MAKDQEFLAFNFIFFRIYVQPRFLEQTLTSDQSLEVLFQFRIMTKPYLTTLMVGT